MRKYAIAVLLGLTVFPVTAQAKGHYAHTERAHSFVSHRAPHVAHSRSVHQRASYDGIATRHGAPAGPGYTIVDPIIRFQRRPVTYYDARPRLWCGWYMRQVFGVPDRALNLAYNWAHWGHPTLPHVGAVVVWWHHVGLIEGGPDAKGRWLVRSGNDGNTVRTRYLSIARAMAFREP